MGTEVSLKEIFGDEPYRKLVEAIRDFGVFHLDREGRIVSWNAGATALLGYSETEIIGKPYSSIFTNEDRESGVPERELKEVSETGRAEDMRWHPRRDGTRFYANCVMTALLDEHDRLCGFAKVMRDDTARMQMELALNTSEVRYRRLFEAAYDGILILKAETGQIADVNPFLCELLDYPKAELIGKELWEIGLFKDRAESQAAFRKLQETGYIRYEDIPLETKGGLRCEVEFISNVYWEGNQQVIQCNIRDITGRKRAEKSIRFQAHLLDTVEQSVIATDLDGIVIYWNQFAQQLYGWTAQEAIGRHIIELTTPEAGTEQALEIMSQLRQGESWVGELNVQRRDGTTFLVQIINSPVKDDEGALVGIVGVSTCITERKRQEQAIRESENKYRLLMEQASDGIHTYDMQGNIIETNSKLSEMLGYTTEELLQLNVKDLIPAEDLAVDPIRFDELRAGKTLLKERRLRRKDGTLLTVEISGKMIRDNVLQAIIRDITERKQQEDSLLELTRQLEQQTNIFNTTLSSISDFAYIFDRDGRFIYANQPLLDLWGLKLDEAAGKNFFDLQYPDHLALRLQQQVQQVFDTGQPVRGETPYTSPTGAEGFYEYIFTPVRASDGRVEVVAGSTRDYTERRRTEAALRDAQERLLQAMDAAKMFSWEMNPDTHEFSFSSNLERTMGFTFPKKIINNPIENHLHPEDAEHAIRKTLHAIETGEPYEDTMRMVNPHTGEIVWMHSRGILTKNANGDARFVGIAQNITERKQAVERLRISEERFRATFEQANVGIVQLSFSGKFLMVNPGFCKIVGYTETECQNMTVKDVTHPDDYELEEAENQRLLSGAISGYSIEKRYLHKNGSIVWGQMTTSLVRRASGEPFYTLAIIEDITERKRAEEELKKINEQLEVRVAERTAALSETNAILQEEITERLRIEAERVELLRRVIFAQEEERRRIAREMHDQFGQGLSALTLKLAALKKEFSEQVKLYEQLEILETVANQLDEDVDFLVWELRPTVLDDLGLPAALKAHVRSWSKHFGTPAELHVSGMTQVRLTSEIETVLYRITQEALNNTAKHARAGKVDIILEHRNHHVSLIIEDDGVGFDDAQAFTTNEKGLGLVGMRERAVLVGGTVEIESHPNEGTTVFIRIPIGREGGQGG